MNENQSALAAELRTALSNTEKELKMFIGVDGFVDEILHVVDKRMDVKNYERITEMAVFHEKVGRAVGYSMNFEFVIQQTKLGGNGPIFANALCWGYR
jgi:hypothetical protein